MSNKPICLLSFLTVNSVPEPKASLLPLHIPSLTLMSAFPHL